MAEFTAEQCKKGECLVSCMSCEATIHLDDSDDFSLCEECCSEEPILSMLSSENWADEIESWLTSQNESSDDPQKGGPHGYSKKIRRKKSSSEKSCKKTSEKSFQEVI